MTEPEFLAVLVDDNEQDRRNAQRLTHGQLRCIAIRPEGDLEDLHAAIVVDEREPDLLVLDYRLDDVVSGGSQPFGHRAGAVAADFRERQGDLPIVLLTTETNLVDHVLRTPGLRTMFDRVIIKSELDSVERRHQVASILVAIIKGYAALKSLSSEATTFEFWSHLGLSDDEVGEIEERLQIEVPLSTPQRANLLLDGLLSPERPGPLLSIEQAAARGGVSKGMLESALQGVGRELLYGGPFSDIQPMIWRQRFEAALTDEWFSELEPQYCVVCADRPSSRLCGTCRRGVDERHFVFASEPSAPSWVDRPVVCYRCVEDGSADEVTFPASSRPIVDALRNEGWQGE